MSEVVGIAGGGRRRGVPFQPKRKPPKGEPGGIRHGKIILKESQGGEEE